MSELERLFEFRVVADTVQEVEQFLKEIEAQDAGVEEYWYRFPNGNQDIKYCYGIGVTHYKPKLIRRIADFMDLLVIYTKVSSKF